MEVGEGMVAVVRGLKDAGLTVTLLDAGRQYTLYPQAVTHPVSPRPKTSHTIASQCTSETVSTLRESGVQATDGRYASTYKMMHCHMVPTSPPHLVTEFPPQKAELYPGRENFEVGGTGSGENYCHPTRYDSFRGAMVWPEKGSTFSSKPSIQQNSFTSSLRRYPNVSQDHSSEIVEKLITYTQEKNSSKNRRCNVSPTRNIDSDISNQTYNLETNLPTYPTPTKCPNRGYDPEISIRPKRIEESPTREKARRGPAEEDTLESWRRSTFCKTNDVRYLRDVSKKVRDGIRSLSHHPNNQPEKLNTKDRLSSNITDRSIGAQSNTNSVNMEIQAAVQMVSREVVTLPIVVPSQRTIAVPVTPSISRAEQNSEGYTNPLSELDIIPQSSQTVQSELKPVDMNIETVINSVEHCKRKSKRYTRSKSQGAIRISNDVLDVVDRSHSRSNRSSKSVKLTTNIETIQKHDNIICEHKLGLTSTNNCKELKRFLSYTRIFHSEVASQECFNVEDLTEILEDWLNLIPLKPEERFNETTNKEFLFSNFFDCVKYFACNPLESNRRYKIKSDILSRLDPLPIEVKGNRRIFLHRLADILIHKIKHIGSKQYNKSTNNSLRESSTFERYVAPTEEELKIFISTKLMLFLDEIGLKIKRREIEEIKDDLLDCIIFSMGEIRLGNDRRCKKNIIKLLGDYAFAKFQATRFADILLANLKESVIKVAGPAKVQSDIFIVLPNIQNVELISKPILRDSEISIKSYKNQDATFDTENNDLCRQIDEWLSSLNLQIPECKENRMRQEVIHDLAGDIMDRQKYLKLSPTGGRTNETEIEHLKYQIFKWINKLVGEDNLVPTEHAPDLMRRIQDIAIPAISNSHVTNMSNPSQVTYVNNIFNRNKRPLCRGCDVNIKFKGCSSKFDEPDMENKNETSNYEKISNCSKKVHKTSMSHVGISRSNIDFLNSDIKKHNQLNCGLDSNKNSSQSLKSMEQLEAEYEQFVKNWVQQIPIETSYFEDETTGAKARIGILNGLWKVLSKLNCDPATYYNHYLYEDLLEDAIDDLLDCLPQTSELTSRRNLLKAQFIEKTVNINDHIKASKKGSFKNKLVKNVIVNLHKQGLINNNNDDSLKMHEDLQIIKLVEEYLLFIRFKNDNKVISEVFKKKLLEQVKEFTESLKINHETELKHIDVTSCMTDIMNALQKVPVPSEKTLKDEADDIILGIEVEQWYNKLPIIPNENSLNLYQRKRQIDMLIKKIKDMKNNVNENSVSAVRNEISRFLEKVPIMDGDTVDINLTVDELINRIKNLKNQDTNLQNMKRVAFQNYEDFEKDIHYSSSASDMPSAKTNEYLMPQFEKDNITTRHSNQTSTYDKLLDESRSTRPHSTHDELLDYKIFSEERPVSSSFKESPNQWYSLKEDSDHIQSQDVPMQNPQDFISPQKYPEDISKILNGTDNRAVEQNYYHHIGSQKTFGEEDLLIFLSKCFLFSSCELLFSAIRMMK